MKIRISHFAKFVLKILSVSTMLIIANCLIQNNFIKINSCEEEEVSEKAALKAKEDSVKNARTAKGKKALRAVGPTLQEVE